MICLEKIEDIPRLQELFAQILIVHHQARSDVLKVKGSKFTDKELEGVIGDANKPVFVYEDEAGTILCHLFLIIKEVSENDGPQKPIKTLFIDDLCVEEKARGQKLGEKLYQFALDYATEIYRNENYPKIVVFHEMNSTYFLYQKAAHRCDCFLMISFSFSFHHVGSKSLLAYR